MITWSLFVAERERFELSEGYSPSPVFKTGAINQLDHLSVICRADVFYNNSYILSIDTISF